MLTFPLPYVFDVDEDITFATRTIVFESQKKQVQRVAINPLRTWRITCRGSNEERLILKNFHESVGGNSNAFLFTDPDGIERIVRFAEPKLSIKDIREFTTSNVTHGNIVGFTADIVLEIAL